MKQLSTPIGIVLTALGVLIGFSLPMIASRWSGLAEVAQEGWVQFRAIIGIVLVILGTAFQLHGSWPTNIRLRLIARRVGGKSR
jgi:vacuolar-type H+-ATPase subunit I/STV1